MDGHVRLVDPMILARRILDEYVLGPAVPRAWGAFILDGDAFYVKVKQPPHERGGPPGSAPHGDSWITKRSKSR